MHPQVAHQGQIGEPAGGGGVIPEDWQAMSSQDLRKLLEEKQAALTNLRFQKALQQLENPHQLRSARRDIARLQTVLKEIQLGSRKEAGVE